MIDKILNRNDIESHKESTLSLSKCSFVGLTTPQPVISNACEESFAIVSKSQSHCISLRQGSNLCKLYKNKDIPSWRRGAGVIDCFEARALRYALKRATQCPGKSECEISSAIASKFATSNSSHEMSRRLRSLEKTSQESEVTMIAKQSPKKGKPRTGAVKTSQESEVFYANL